MAGTLFIVATPIGNLKDITLRALDVLLSVPIIACEDTRRTGILLKALREANPTQEIAEKPHLISYYEENEQQRIEEIIAWLQNENNVALVSDAGTPLVSDPGFKLIRECIHRGIQVEALPGASSVLTALVVSGLPTDKFLFIGYLPHKPSHRIQTLEKVKAVLDIVNTTLIFFEAPHKLLTTLTEFKDVIGDTEIVIARELTKTYQEVRHETVSAAIEHFTKTPPKGEFVILYHPKD